MRNLTGIISICLLGGALLAGPAAWTQDAGGATPPTGYVVCAGDVLSIAVFGEEGLTGSFPVSATGNVRLQLVGDQEVEGYTPAQVQEKLTEELKRFLKRPHVTVTLDEQASKRRVYVTGEVKNGGAYELPLGAQPLDAIGAAGGFGELADPSEVEVLSGAQTRVVDLSRPTAEGVTLAGGLRTGDFVFVPRSRKVVSIVGYVTNPGRYPWEEGITLLDVIGQYAGGPAEAADLSAASLVREGGEREAVNLQKLLGDGDLSQDRLLQPGDTLVVPRARAISVVGQVTHPTSFSSTDQVRVLDAVAQAAGVLPTANASGTLILRGSETVPVDLDALLRRGDVTQNLALEAGDVLVVPEAESAEILVVGEVKQPGAIQPRVGITALGAVTEADGPTEMADMARVTIVRADGTEVADLTGVASGGALRNNLALRAGDVVLVPALDKVYVFGGVRTAGPQPMPRERTLLGAISGAGGTVADALLGDVRILRASADGPKREVIHCDVGRLLGSGDAEQNAAIEPGDVIFVPERGKPKDYGILRDIMYSAAWVVSLFR